MGIWVIHQLLPGHWVVMGSLEKEVLGKAPSSLHLFPSGAWLGAPSGVPSLSFALFQDASGWRHLGNHVAPSSLTGRKCK